MGTIIDYKALDANGDIYVLPIYCFQLNTTGETCFSVNKPLSQKLIDIKETKRTMNIERSLWEIIKELPENVIIKDIDVLFNPNYHIDVLNILIKLYRQKHFRLLWSGRLINDKLVYAEIGRPDYHEYDISKYDIVCVK